jgi:hypothetical protein
VRKPVPAAELVAVATALIEAGPSTCQDKNS